MNNTNLAIVVPCYNEEAVIESTAGQLGEVLDSMIRRGLISAASRIYFVDDGSSDKTWLIIGLLSERDSKFCGVKLSRNRGHQNALLAGLRAAEGDVVLTIDADLQDDITVIPEMVEQYAAGAEIIYAVRSSRTTDTFFKRLTAQSFYKLMGAFGVQTVYNHADFRLMSRRAVAALLEFREVNLYLRGIIPLLGFRSCSVSYERKERFAGETKYPLRKMIGLALNAITSFSTIPLRMITGVGFFVLAGTVVTALWVLWVRFFTDIAYAGWASTLLPIIFLGGIQIFCTGILGEYLGKIYTEVKDRPRFFIEKVIDNGTEQK